MRSTQLLYAAAALPWVLFAWRFAGMEAGLGALRGELAQVEAGAVTRGKGPRENFPSTPVEAPREDPAPGGDGTPSISTGAERTVEELQQVKDRIDGLESTVSDLSKAWNRFATEVENKRAQEQIYETATREMARRFEAIQQVEEGHGRNEAMKASRAQVNELNRVISKERK